jgi:radical SAM protein with 4Fe4S-binding SPASM domain
MRVLLDAHCLFKGYYMNLVLKSNEPIVELAGSDYSQFYINEIEKYVIILKSSYKFYIFDELELAWFKRVVEGKNLNEIFANGKEIDNFNVFLQQIIGVLKQDNEIRKYRIMRSNDFSIKIDLTKLCNLSCTHCFQDESYNSSPVNYLNYEDLKYFILNIHNKLPDNINIEITLSGGEALLYPDITELISYIKKIPRTTSIVLLTNGILLKKKLHDIDKLDYVQFSLDGITKDVYETRRNGADFSDLMESISYAQGKEKKIGFNITIGKDNKNDIKNNLFDFIKLYNLQGKIDINFTKMMDIGLAKKNDLCITNTEFNLFLYDLLLSYKKVFNINKKFKFINNMAINCNIDQHINISYDSKIWMCGFANKIGITDINNFDLENYSLFVNKYYHSTSVDSLQECSECIIRYHCKGRCKIHRDKSFKCNEDIFKAGLINLVNQRMFGFKIGD